MVDFLGAFDLGRLSRHPWDKVSHAVIGLVISAPFFLAGVAVIFWLGADPFWLGVGVLLPLVGAAAALGVFYGREQSQHWKKYPDELVGSWFFWNWSRDGVLDWLVLWPPLIILLGLFWSAVAFYLQ